MEDLLPMEVACVSTDASNFNVPSRNCQNGDPEVQGDYFFWLESQNQAEVFDLFDPEIRSLSPVVAPSPLITTPSFQPKTTYTPASPTYLDPKNSFDPDEFLDNFLCSSEGQAILNSPEQPPVLEDCQEIDNLMATAIAPPPLPLPFDVKEEKPELRALTNVDMGSWDYLVRNAALPPPPASSTSGSSSSPHSEEEEDDISISSDDDPTWHPSGGGAPSSSDEESTSSSSYRPPTRPIASTSRPSRKGRLLGPRQPRTKDERRERKKGQNRTAAMKYREKKRIEKEEITRNLGDLQANNIRLKTRVDTMREDIRYFKNLMITVLEAKLR